MIIPDQAPPAAFSCFLLVELKGEDMLVIIRNFKKYSKPEDFRKLTISERIAYDSVYSVKLDANKHVIEIHVYNKEKDCGHIYTEHIEEFSSSINIYSTTFDCPVRLTIGERNIDMDSFTIENNVIYNTYYEKIIDLNIDTKYHDKIINFENTTIENSKEE